MTPRAVAPSPCINVCRMDAASGLCEGCARTLAEIGGWVSMTEADKHEVLRQLPLRRVAPAVKQEPR